MADWLRIAAPFFGQLFQERGDELQKARERTIGLAEDRYKSYMDTGRQVGIQTLKQMMEEQSPAYQQDLATSKAQEGQANVGAAAKQAELDAYNALTPEEKRRLQIAPAIQNEAYAKQVGLQEKERNKTPSQVHLENEQKWVDLITGPAFVANPDYEAAYQAAIVLGLDSQPKSAGYSARFADWFKGPYTRRDNAKAKDDALKGVKAEPIEVSGFNPTAYTDVDQVGAPPQGATPSGGAGVEPAMAAAAPSREEAIQALMLKRNPKTGQRFTRQEAEATTDSLMSR